MEHRQMYTVYGYIRMNQNQLFPMDIIQLIYQFYLIRMDSKILDSTEQILLFDLLYNTLKKKTKI